MFCALIRSISSRIFLRGYGVLGARDVQHHAGQPQPTAFDLTQRQQRVIDRAQRRIAHQQHWKTNFGGKIGHERASIQRHQLAAHAFDDHHLMPCAQKL